MESFTASLAPPGESLKGKKFFLIRMKREFDELMMVIIIRSSRTSSTVNAWWRMKKKKRMGKVVSPTPENHSEIWSWNTRRIWNFSLCCCWDWSSHSAWVVDVFYNVKNPPSPHVIPHSTTSRTIRNLCDTVFPAYHSIFSLTAATAASRPTTMMIKNH